MTTIKSSALLAVVCMVAVGMILPPPIAYADALPMTKTVSVTVKLTGKHVAADFAATKAFDDGTYTGTLARQNATLKSIVRATPLLDYCVESDIEYPIDKSAASQFSYPATYTRVYHDAVSGQDFATVLPKLGAPYFYGTAVTQYVYWTHYGYEYDPEGHTKLGYQSNNTSTYYGGSYSYSNPPRQPTDYYGPSGEAGLGWAQYTAPVWDGALQDATLEPWRTICLDAHGVARFVGDDDGSSNRYRKPVRIFYRRSAQCKYIYQRYQGNASVTDTEITYTGTVTRDNAAPTVTLTNSPVEPNAGSSTTLSINGTDPDEDDLTVTVSWQPMGANNNTPGTISTLYSAARPSGSGFTLPRTSLAVGYYKVIATAKDEGGLTGTATITIHVNTGPAVTITNTPTEPNDGGSVSVSVTPTDADDANVTLLITWQPMGTNNATPGTNTTICNASKPTGAAYTFSRTALAAGYYKVTATVTDAGGLSNTATITIHVNGAPVVTLSSSPIKPIEGGSVTLSSNAVDPDGDSVAVVVTWQAMGADNNTPGTVSTLYNATRASGSALSLTQSSLAKGYFKVTTKATDAGGLSDTATITIHVNGAPVVSLSSSPIKALEGGSVTLSTNAVDPDGDSVAVVVSWQPMGADNDTPGAVTTLYVATRPSDSPLTIIKSSLVKGYYKVTITANDYLLQTDTATITVRVYGKPTITLTNTPTVPNSGSSVTLNTTGTDPDGDSLAVVVTWQPMGTNNATPGTITTLYTGTRPSGSAFSLTQSSLARGYYKVTATATDYLGLSATVTITVRVNGAPAAAITHTPATIDENGTANIAITPTDPDGDVCSLTVKWQPMGIDNNTPGTVTTVVSSLSHTSGQIYSFSKASLAGGYYTVTATVTDPGGLSATATHSVRVAIAPATNEPPQVDIYYDKTGLTEGDNVTVYCQPSDPNGDDISLTVQIQNLGILGQNPSPPVTTFSGIVPSGTAIPYTIYGLYPSHYKVTAVATDPGGLTGSNTSTFIVGPAAVQGQVNHTVLWEEHRNGYNAWAEHTGLGEQRPYELFFRGERFKLVATSSSYMHADRVTVQIVEHPEYVTDMVSTDGYNWTADLWGAEMFHWDAQDLTFRFSCYYPDGTVSIHEPEVAIDKETFFRRRRLY